MTKQEKRREYNRRYIAAHREAVNATRRRYYHNNKHVFQKAAAKWESANRDQVREARHAYKLLNPERMLLIGAKVRARARGVPFDLTVSDIHIPSHCPVLGMPLKRGDRSAAPSLDRRIPALGYVKGNVAVISNRANTLKSNSTADELRAIVRWLNRNSDLL